MDDGDAPAQASQQAPPQRESAPMANAVWRDNVAVLRQVIGDGPWRSWLVYAIPESDDGETLTLAAPTKFIATYIKDNFGETIEGVIDRRLVVEHRVWCGQAMDAHRAKEAAEAEAAKGAPE
jgi:chromosomal replication initiation ATPase DnaA